MCVKAAPQEQRDKGTGLYRRNFADGMLCGNAMRACSACAGDYEDPDRTAWRPDESDDDERGERIDDAAAEPLGEEFPAEK